MGMLYTCCTHTEYNDGDVIYVMYSVECNNGDVIYVNTIPT